MATVAEPQPAELPLPGGRPGGAVRLHPLLTATALAAPELFHRGPGRRGLLRALGVGVPRERWVRFPVPAFLVEHPGAGAVLVDTGLHPSVAVDPRQNMGRLNRFPFKEIEMEPGQATSAQARVRGIDPSAVRVVILTHLHRDHASAISEFPQATFLLSRREWESANAPRPVLRGYLRRQFDHAVDYRLVDFDGPAADSFATFGRSFDVFGDGSVRVVDTPGHTAGHLSVVLRLAAREALLAGDAAYTRRTLRESHLPTIMADEHNFKRSLREIQLYAEQTPDALIIPGHDIEAWSELELLY